MWNKLDLRRGVCKFQNLHKLLITPDVDFAIRSCSKLYLNVLYRSSKTYSVNHVMIRFLPNISWFSRSNLHFGAAVTFLLQLVSHIRFYRRVPVMRVPVVRSQILIHLTGTQVYTQMRMMMNICISLRIVVMFCLEVP